MTPLLKRSMNTGVMQGFLFLCSSRRHSPERAVLAVIAGRRGRLLLGPLHLCLPHAGLPVLQEGRHRLQGKLTAATRWWAGGTASCTTGRYRALVSNFNINANNKVNQGASN